MDIFEVVFGEKGVENLTGSMGSHFGKILHGDTDMPQSHEAGATPCHGRHDRPDASGWDRSHAR